MAYDMNRKTEDELKEAPDYEELKWHDGVAVIVGALGETWKRLTAAEGYSAYFVVADENGPEEFYGTYSADEPIENSD